MPNAHLQGDPGDNFYVVTEGDLAAYIAAAGDEPIQEYQAGDTFGELALLHGSPRAASVKATTACVLWALDRRAFRALVTSHNLSSKHGIVQVLSQIPALRDPEVREEQIQALADAVTIEDYSDGEYIITMGSEADSLFIILSGEVVCHLGAGTEELMRQSAGSDSAFFGESCLTDEKVRGANVVAWARPCFDASAQNAGKTAWGAHHTPGGPHHPPPPTSSGTRWTINAGMRPLFVWVSTSWVGTTDPATGGAADLGTDRG